MDPITLTLLGTAAYAWYKGRSTAAPAVPVAEHPAPPDLNALHAQWDAECLAAHHEQDHDDEGVMQALHHAGLPADAHFVSVLSQVGDLVTERWQSPSRGSVYVISRSTGWIKVTFSDPALDRVSSPFGPITTMPMPGPIINDPVPPVSKLPVAPVWTSLPVPTGPILLSRPIAPTTVLPAPAPKPVATLPVTTVVGESEAWLNYNPGDFVG